MRIFISKKQYSITDHEHDGDIFHIGDALPPFKPGLAYILISKLHIVELHPFPATLVRISLIECGLTSLPELPAALEFLNCERNELISLPALPPLLKALVASFNKLRELPTLPLRLETCYVQNNQLIQLGEIPHYIGEIPHYMRIFNCSNNLLTSLPAIPPSIDTLHCSCNRIEVIPPMRVESVYLGYNPLYKVPDFESYTVITCSADQVPLFRQEKVQIYHNDRCNTQRGRHDGYYYEILQPAQVRAEAQKRTAAAVAVFKEELIMRVFSPRRPRLRCLL